MLTTDNDFKHFARRRGLNLWGRSTIALSQTRPRNDAIHGGPCCGPLNGRKKRRPRGRRTWSGASAISACPGGRPTAPAFLLTDRAWMAD